MRPRKSILLVDADEIRASIRRFQLHSSGYRVAVAHDEETAIELHAEGFDMVLGWAGNDRMRGARVQWADLARRMKLARHQTRILLVGDRLNPDEMGSVDGWIGVKGVSTFDLIDQIRMMVARKWGPRKKPRGIVTHIERADMVVSF